MIEETKYKNPRLKTINLEIKDFEYYINEEFNSEKVDFDFNFTLEKKDNYIELFIHLRHSYIQNKDKISIYHSDHISKFEPVTLENNGLDFKVSTIADFMGRVILMIKGYYDSTTKGFLINEFELPVFNPTELIKIKYDLQINDKDIISFE